MNELKVFPDQNIFSKNEEDKSFIITVENTQFDYLELDGLSSVIWEIIYHSPGCTREKILSEVEDDFDGDPSSLPFLLEKLLSELKDLKIIKESHD